MFFLNFSVPFTLLLSFTNSVRRAINFAAPIFGGSEVRDLCRMIAFSTTCLSFWKFLKLFFPHFNGPEIFMISFDSILLISSESVHTV